MAESVEDVAVALTLICIVGSVALLVSVSIPVSVPAATGLYVTVKFTVCPAANDAGTVRPVTVTPVPVYDILVIDADSAPVFSSFTVCVCSLPTATSPKVIAAGVAVSAAPVTPVPLRATSEGELAALLAIVIIPVSLAPVVGLNAAVMDAVWPALSDIGSFGPEAVNPVPDTEIAEMVSESVPLLDNVTDCVALCPTAKFPKLRTVADRFSEAPVVSGVVGLPAIPTQLDVTTITRSVATPARVRRMDLRANRCERIAFTRAPSRMGARFITTRIVRWGRFPELLAEGTHLGQGHYPVREDSFLMRARSDRPSGHPVHPEPP